MKKLTVALAGLAGFMLIAASSASSANLKLLTSWNKNIWPTYVVLDRFLKNVNKIGGDKIKIKISDKDNLVLILN